MLSLNRKEKFLIVVTNAVVTTVYKKEDFDHEKNTQKNRKFP